MSDFTFHQQLGASWGEMGVDIRDLVVLETSGDPVLLAITGPGGGVMSLRFSSGQLQQFDQNIFPEEIRGDITGATALLRQGNETYLVLGETAQGDAVIYAVAANGEVAAASAPDMPIFVGDSGPVIATSAQGYVYTTTAKGRLQGFREDAGGYRAVTTHTDTDETYASDPVALEVVQAAQRMHLVVSSKRARSSID